jgi:hypothetical protein
VRSDVINDNLAKLPLGNVRGDAECFSVQQVGNGKYIPMTLTGLPSCKKAAIGARAGAQLKELPTIPDIYYALRECRDDGEPQGTTDYGQQNSFGHIASLGSALHLSPGLEGKLLIQRVPEKPSPLPSGLTTPCRALRDLSSS